jgi:hypothetical protein
MERSNGVWDGTGCRVDIGHVVLDMESLERSWSLCHKGRELVRRRLETPTQLVDSYHSSS